TQDDDVATTNAADVRLTNLLSAINNDVAMLSNLSLKQDDDESSKVSEVRTISLANLESSLSSGAAASVTTAVNTTSPALQTFLNGGSAQATAVDSALNAAGVNPSSALAILTLNDGRLV